MSASIHSASSKSRIGIWEPLPAIIYAVVIHPLELLKTAEGYTIRPEDLGIDPIEHGDTKALQTLPEDLEPEEPVANPHLVPLEIGDEIYAFEKFVPDVKHGAEWYKGYVVSTSLQTPVSLRSTDAPSAFYGISPAPLAIPPEEQKFSKGIFPASHIHIREHLPDAQGHLLDIRAKLVTPQTETAPRVLGGMVPLQEEDELGRNHRLASRNPRGSRPARPVPIIPSTVDAQLPSSDGLAVLKPPPPRPSLKSSDETVSGASEPLIDEIASALREWHILMFKHLQQKDYRLFTLVKEHIEALHLGRRQLLNGTLGAEETAALRRECVTRLVKGNIAQGLDVIVRHPVWGSLVTVEHDGGVNPRSWMSAVRMFMLQSALAYIESQPTATSTLAKLSALSHPEGTRRRSGSSLLASPSSPIRPSAKFVPNMVEHLNSALSPSPQAPIRQAGTFFHVYLEIRAFVASLTLPGETAELYFSLYSKSISQFISEEFCAILDHHGVLARDPDGNSAPGHIRALFNDVGEREAKDDIYLVCRIVRNGAMKLGTPGHSNIDTLRRGSEPALRNISENAESTPLNRRNSGMSTPPDSQSRYFRRPFGAAVLELSALKTLSHEGIGSTAATEHILPIFVPTTETTFSNLHQHLIMSNVREFEKSPRAQMIAVVIKAFHGESDVITRENPSLLHNVPTVARLGFPDVVFPGDSRNDVYIKLWSGEFYHSTGGGGRLRHMPSLSGSSGGPTTVQVTLEVRTRAGALVEGAISQGVGEAPVSRFCSLVFHRTNKPTFGELVKLRVAPDILPQCHLFFTFRHRSTRERNGAWGSVDPVNHDRVFAYAYLPLCPDGQAFVADGSHGLVLYRADKCSWSSAEEYYGIPATLKSGQRLEDLVIPPHLVKTASPIRESLIIRSLLCSTQYTQNSVLLGLLSWDKLGNKSEDLKTVLARFPFVGEVEIVKFLRDIFDCLFSILVSPINDEGDLDDLVFNALVVVLGIIQDRRFKNFEPVLDLYIEQHFTYAAASSNLMRSMNRLLASPSSEETAAQLRAAFKVWHYILKFMVRARMIQKSKEVGMGATSEHLEATFKKDLRSHISDVNALMRITNPSSLIGTQTIALQQFPSIIPDLGLIFSPGDVVSMISDFSDSLRSVKGRMVIWKLVLYLQVVRGYLFDLPDTRAAIVEAMVGWIKPYLGRYDEYRHTRVEELEAAKDNARIGWLETLRLSIAVIAVMLDKLQQVLVDPVIREDRRAYRLEEANVGWMLSLLPRVVETYHEFQSSENLKAMERTRSPTTTATSLPIPFPASYPFSLISEPTTTSSRTFINGVLHHKPNYYNCGLAEVAVVFVAMVLISTSKDLLTFFEMTLEIERRNNLTRLLTSVFAMGTSILNNDAFPNSWLNIDILSRKILLKLTEPIAVILIRDFIPGASETTEHDFDQSLWFDFIHLLLTILSSNQLIIEELSPQKRRAVWRLAGDIRGEGASLLLKSWGSLGWAQVMSTTGQPIARYGRYQTTLIDLVDETLNLCLSLHDDLRTHAVQILFSMILSEFESTGDFIKIETELINKMDELFMSEMKTDDLSRALFVQELRGFFDQCSVDQRLRDRMTDSLNSVDDFLLLLASVRELPDGEEYQDDRVIATLRLMNFIRRIGRNEIYIKYVHQLVNMHLQNHNYIEAGLTLKLHADLHDWDLTTPVDPLPDLHLPRQSAFVRKETLYLLVIDFLGKGKAYESAIDICQEIATQHMEVTFNYPRLMDLLRQQAALLNRIMTDERVHPDYYRVSFYGDFPGALRDKHFIYRSLEHEPYEDFYKRMQEKYSGAYLNRTPEEPSDEVKFGSQQYVQIVPVIPEPDRSHPIFTSLDVPPRVKAYYENCAINTFSYTRSFTRLSSTGDTGDVWILKTYLTTEDFFPTVLRRSEVVETHDVETSPVENALAAIEQRTKQLSMLEVRYSALAKIDAVTNTNALAMVLNSALDVPPDAGVNLYRPMFLTEEYLSLHPDQVGLVRRLSAAIMELTQVIDKCLKLHGEHCPEDMLDFHGQLMKLFQKTFNDELQRLAVPTRMSPSLTTTTQSPTLAMNVPSSPLGGNTVNPPFRRQSLSSLAVTRDIPSLYVHSPATITYSSEHPAMNLSGAQTPLQRSLVHLTRHGMLGMLNSLTNGHDQTDVFEMGPIPNDGATKRSSASLSLLEHPAHENGSTSVLSRGASISGATSVFSTKISRYL